MRRVTPTRTDEQEEHRMRMERTSAAWRWGAVALLAAALWTTLADPPARAYTPEQVTAGEQVYRTSCGACHGARGEGAGPDAPEAPAVIGPRALTGFRDGQDLYDYTADSMPQDNPGSLPSQDYWNVLAWLLAQNGLSGPGPALGPATANGVSLRR
jgi:mono/diheme cytochrome c family protein